jgi:hypothetical protein
MFRGGSESPRHLLVYDSGGPSIRTLDSKTVFLHGVIAVLLVGLLYSVSPVGGKSEGGRGVPRPSAPSGER